MTRVWSAPGLCRLSLGLWLMVAGCSGSEGSKGSGSAGGEGNTSGSSSTGGKSGGDGGEFEAIWRRVSAELSVIDSTTPTAPETVNFDFPGKVTHPEYETEVEIFEELKNDTLIVYAHFDGAEVQHRMVYELLKADDSYLWQSSSGSTGVYTLEDGALTLTQTQASDTSVVLSETHYEKYDGDFPPGDWPADVIDVPGVTP